MKKLFFKSFVRILLLAVLLLSFGISARADRGVILSLKDGREATFAFSSKPRLTIGEELIISADDGTFVSYNYLEIKHVRYGDITSTGINEVESTSLSSNVVFRVNDGRLQVFGLPAGESVSVYGLNGQRVTTHEQGQDNTVISIFLNAHSVHIIRTSNGISCKVVTP